MQIQAVTLFFINYLLFDIEDLSCLLALTTTSYSVEMLVVVVVVVVSFSFNQKNMLTLMWTVLRRFHDVLSAI